MKAKLGNGLTIIYEKLPTNSVTINVLVKTGSNNEDKTNYGISHFIEHMLFEGTKKRPSSLIVSNEIEKLGGEINAYTTSDRTCYYIKILKKHFDKALDVISDIIINSLFKEKAIEKERKVILKEINMVTDDPRNHQWILFQKRLFDKHPVRNPTYGTREIVSRLCKQDILDYFNKYYVSNNMIVSVVGGVSNPYNKIKKYFSDIEKKKIESRKYSEPKNRFKQIKEKRKLLNSYFVLGYKTADRTKKDSFVLDVVKAILARGQSGKLFDEIRNKRGLAYEVGILHESSIDYGFFAVYLGADKSKLNTIKGIILNEFKKLRNIDNKELNEAKQFIEGDFYLQNEDTHNLADHLAYWEMVKGKFSGYIKNIKKVTKKDIVNVVDKYLNGNYTLAVIEQN